MPYKKRTVNQILINYNSPSLYGKCYIYRRQPLQNFVEKDDSEYIKSLSGKNLAGGIDFSRLKFATGNYFKKDEEDDPFNNGGMGGMGNNPIMWALI